MGIHIEIRKIREDRCAARKLIDHWQRGEFPDRTSWAA